MRTSDSWKDILDGYAEKKVTPTDKSKHAYVLTSEQRQIILSAGHLPDQSSNKKTIEILVLSGDRPFWISASFYDSERKDPKRDPEPRLGQEFTGTWLNAGDTVAIGRIGDTIVAATIPLSASATERLGETLSQLWSASSLEALRAKLPESPVPERTQVQRLEFVRSPAIKALVLKRAQGQCENPECKSAPVIRSDGSVYLEIHHLKRLADGGPDTLENAVAVCANCHRSLHIGRDQVEIRDCIRKHVFGEATLPE